MVVDTQLYDLMGIRTEASEDEIRTAYKKLAKKYHPDRNPNPEDSEKFKEISYAYEILSNSKTRATYDRVGVEGLQEGRSGGGGADIFEHMFGGMGGMGSMFGGMFGGGGRRGPPKNEDTALPLKVTLEDVFNGKTAKVKVPRDVLCGTCKGSGCKSGASMKRCVECKGQGVKMSFRQIGPGMVTQVRSRCDACHGEGETVNASDKCKKCTGRKVLHEEKELEVHVDKGMVDNQKVLLRGEGNQMPDTENGNVIVVLQLEDHPVFTRQGSDLYMRKEIGLTEALCGFELTFKHLDDRDLLIKSPPGKIIHPGSKKVINSEGMPQHRNQFLKGDLIIQFDVKFPDHEFAGVDKLKKLELLLPKRPPSDPIPEDHEEVALHEYHGTTNGAGSADMDEDDEEGHGSGVRCHQQ